MRAQRKGPPVPTEIVPPARCQESKCVVPDSEARAEALSTVAQQLQGPLLRFLSRRVGSKEEAKDILQDACVRVLAGGCPEPIQSLDRYLWRCALNLSIDYGRKHQRWERFGHERRAYQEQVAPSAESEVDAQQQLELINAVARVLPPKCYEAFMLRIAQGLRFDDVGRKMQVSARMAKIYVARTLSCFQNRLSEASAGRGASNRFAEPVPYRIGRSGMPERQAPGRQTCGRRVCREKGHSPKTRIERITRRNPANAFPRGSALAATIIPPRREMTMQQSEAVSVLQSLIEGRDPVSGEPLPSDSCVHRAEVMRALLAGVDALQRKEARDLRRSQLPKNVGMTWSEREENELVAAFKAGEAPESIARRHRRTLRAIEARLERLGLLRPQERVTQGGFPAPV